MAKHRRPQPPHEAPHPGGDGAFLSAVLEHTADMVIVIDGQARLRYANAAAGAALGRRPDELVGVGMLDLVHPEDAGLAVESLGSHGFWNGELTLRTAEGDEVPTVATLQAHREHGEIVLISTIAVNDTLGHDAGDHVLIELGRSLRVGVHTGDLVARLGGDEFCVLCEGVESEQEVLDLGRRICDVVALPMRVRGRDVQLGTSIGIALDRGGTQAIGALLRNADVALDRAKRAGGSRVEMFDLTLESAAR